MRLLGFDLLDNRLRVEAVDSKRVEGIEPRGGRDLGRTLVCSAEVRSGRIPSLSLPNKIDLIPSKRVIGASLRLGLWRCYT